MNPSDIFGSYNPYIKVPVDSKIPISYSDYPERRYAAGLFDAAGYIHAFLDKHGKPSLALKIVLNQSDWEALEFLYYEFGGEIRRFDDDYGDKVYEWIFSDVSDIVAFLNFILDCLVMKKEIALKAIEFPTDEANADAIKVCSPYQQYHLFDNAKKAAKFLKQKCITIPEDGKLEIDGWVATYLYTDDDIKKIKAEKLRVHEELRLMKSTIKNTTHTYVERDIAYLAGVLDACSKINFDSNGKVSIKIDDYDYPNINALQCAFGGNISHSHKNIWEWRVCDDECIAVLKEVEPYLIAKNERATLLLNMACYDKLAIHKCMDILNNDEEREDINKRLPKYIRHYDDTYHALLRVEKTTYVLGSYELLVDAENQYKKYRDLYTKEKVFNKQFVDWNTEFSVLQKQPLIFHREKYIYNTRTNMFQIKIFGDVFGTYTTFEKAVKARDLLIKYLQDDAYPIFVREFHESMQHDRFVEYVENKDKEYYRVRFRGKSCGRFHKLSAASSRASELLYRFVLSHDLIKHEDISSLLHIDNKIHIGDM